MNTRLQGIPSTARSADDRLIPAQTPIMLPLIQRLADAHAAILENWKRKYALDLNWHRAVPATR